LSLLLLVLAPPRLRSPSFLFRGCTTTALFLRHHLGSVCWCTSGAAVREAGGVLHCGGNSCSCHGGVVFISIFILSAFARGDDLLVLMHAAGDDPHQASA
jgi:hypothetical protein